MSIPWRNVILCAGAILLLGAVTAEFWVRALAGAVIDQVVIPLAKFVIALFT